MGLEIKENILLAPYTIYKIGGPAKFFTEVTNAGELKEALEFAAQKKIPFFILGGGSNVLISDRGFDGLIVRMAGGDIKTDGQRLGADAGAIMVRAVNEAARAGLAGFEWAAGIPGTIGGSVRGNSGCFGGEMKDVVESVGIFDVNNAKSFELKNADCNFGYRDSVFKKRPEWIIVSVVFKLQKGDPAEIQKKIEKIQKERNEKQDIGTKSSGCIFKNISWQRKDINKEKLIRRLPELENFRDKPNIPASLLIDRAGLRGYRIGNARISEKHANFFINDGNALAEDIIKLINVAKDTVKKKFGIVLEEEIRYVGF